MRFIIPAITWRARGLDQILLIFAHVSAFPGPHSYPCSKLPEDDKSYGKTLAISMKRYEKQAFGAGVRHKNQLNSAPNQVLHLRLPPNSRLSDSETSKALHRGCHLFRQDRLATRAE